MTDISPEDDVEVFGLSVSRLPESWKPTQVFAIAECLDIAADDSEDNAMRLAVRCSENLTVWQAIGMLRAVLVDLESQYVNDLEEI